MVWLTKSKFLSLFLSIILMSTIGKVLTAQANGKVSKPEYLVIALLQSSSDIDYMKPVQQWFIKIYTESLSRLDITLRYHVLPPKRVILYTDEGRPDGGRFE